MMTFSRHFVASLAYMVFFTIASTIRAEDIYVAQSAVGSDTGADAANAHSLSWLNTAANWATGTGQVSAGDTVHLIGTFTSTLSISSSGSSGSPITILFEPGAKFSKAYWGTDSSSAIYVPAKSYIIISGGSNGIIECTANGDALANNVACEGIRLYNCTGVEIKNLTIQNIYVHTYGTANVLGGYTTNAIKASNCNALSVHGCTINNAYVGIYCLTETAVSISGPNLYANTISACSTGLIIACGAGGGGDSFSNVNVYNNDVTMGRNWYEAADYNHIDGIHTWTSSGTMSGLRVFSNYIHGDPSTNCTSPIYVTDNLSTCYVYNNLIVGSGNHPAEGYINCNLTGTADAYIYNNTIIGISSGNTGGTGIAFDPSRAGTIAHVKNNIISSCYVGIYDGSAAVTWDSDYNDIYNCGSVGYRSSFLTTLANWRTASGGDAHSISTNPLLSAAYTIPTNSPAVGIGANLYSLFTADRVGTARAASGGWDIGAYASGASLPVVVPPSKAQTAIQTQ